MTGRPDVPAPTIHRPSGAEMREDGRIDASPDRLGTAMPRRIVAVAAILAVTGVAIGTANAMPLSNLCKVEPTAEHPVGLSCPVSGDRPVGVSCTCQLPDGRIVHGRIST